MPAGAWSDPKWANGPKCSGPPPKRDLQAEKEAFHAKFGNPGYDSPEWKRHQNFTDGNDNYTDYPLLRPDGQLEGKNAIDMEGNGFFETEPDSGMWTGNWYLIPAWRKWFHGE